MASFRDKAAGEWEVGITVGALRRVLNATGIDLMKLFEPDGPNERGDDPSAELRKLLLRPVVIADVIFAAVEPEAKRRGVDVEAFGELLEGNALAEATDALMTALEVFFSAQNQEMGATFGDMVRKFGEARSAVWVRAHDMISTMNPNEVATKAFDEALARATGPGTSGNSFGNSPESSASTPSP